jgi:pilus assembly protein CpaB
VRASTIVMIGFAVVFGLLAVFIAQVWLNNQAAMRAKSMQTDKKPVATQTIVVANTPLRFGAVLDASMLKEMPWPQAGLPAGAFHKINDVLAGGRRVVLTAIEANEPVLALKITGAGERATLSALVRKGMKAVTIRVNDVEGVGGFVLPGDRVDVVLTRQIDKGSAAAKASVAKSVTLEVSTVEAQKVWLASSVGNLSLLLRKAGETAQAKTRKITLKDLESNEVTVDDKAATTTVVVTRATAKQQYTVPVEGSGTLAAAERGNAAH